MPSEITVTDGRAEMMYVGATPWHGLGHKLDGPATASEAMEAAGLDWDVSMEPVLIGSDGQYAEVPNLKAVVRTDTRRVLAVMTDRYVPVQNREAFSFFDTVVSAGEAIYHTAGSLRGGRRIWVLAKLPGDLRVSRTDILEKYILLVNSHDGSAAVTMRPTTIRVVCNNTLTGALGQRVDCEWRTYHRGDVMQHVNDARETLDLHEAHFELMMRGIERMAADQMEEDHEAFYRDLFAIPEDIEVATSPRVKAVERLYAEGRGNAGETRWDMFNAVTEWVDHERGSDASRLASAWFGSGVNVKRRAWDLLTI